MKCTSGAKSQIGPVTHSACHMSGKVPYEVHLYKGNIPNTSLLDITTLYRVEEPVCVIRCTSNTLMAPYPRDQLIFHTQVARYWKIHHTAIALILYPT